jgi:hypothetical protein
MSVSPVNSVLLKLFYYTYVECEGQNHLASYLQDTGYRLETNLAAASREV